MMDFLKRLLAGSPQADTPTDASEPIAPLLTDAESAHFKTWFLAQRRPAIALAPDSTIAIAAFGSRLGGPAWLADGEEWPCDARGVPLEFIAQLDLADCHGLADYPPDGIVQFFVARDDLYGADFENPAGSTMLVRRYVASHPGALTAPPPLEIVRGIEFSDFTPFQDDAVRTGGIGLRPTLVSDRIDQSVMEAEQRVTDLYRRYDCARLEAFLESDEVARPLRHHSGGYPAYTQSDVRYQSAFAAFDHVLLRLTSDDAIMWGDVGECVFLMRSDDLARGEFADVAYSWDCH